MSKADVEQIKATSGGLRGPLDADLSSGDAFLSEAGKSLLKFHGSYQQEDRDTRRGMEPGPKHYQFMVRSKAPGGQLTGAQYLVHDAIASRYGNETIRITTRQGIQLHGIIKGDLKPTIRELNHALVTTFGACGDVVRNVMACPAPLDDARYRVVQSTAAAISEATFPRTKAYHQIWLDGEPLLDDEEDELYGKVYLPRKFKVAVAFPGDNCVDIFTQDVGLVALFDPDGTHLGFNVLAGGGMGMTHKNEETYPRLADVIGFVGPEHAVEVVKAIVTIHRDFGDRSNRKHARLKYVLQERGVAWFRSELQARLPFPVDDPLPMPEFEIHDHLGWHDQGDGSLFLGLPVDSGRIYNRDDFRLRDGLREVVKAFNPSIRLTAQQNILLTDIRPADRTAIEAILSAHNIQTVADITPVRRAGLACPALPTCGLAIAEAERAFPGVLEQIEAVLVRQDLIDLPISVRMTGCPNGCARPYMAEIGIVGRSLNKYTVFLGGSTNGTRLNEAFQDLVPLGEIATLLEPIFAHYKANRLDSEAFGDYCRRVGVVELRAIAGLLAGSK